MPRRYLLAAGLMLALGAHASEPCSARLTEMIGKGDAAALASLLGSGAADGIARMLSEAGSLSAITPAERPRFVKHARLTVKRAGQSDRYSYAPVWINALSKPLGPVQFHAKVIDAGRCRLAALHLDQQSL
jgi:hypothetical protein